MSVNELAQTIVIGGALLTILTLELWVWQDRGGGHPPKRERAGPEG